MTTKYNEIHEKNPVETASILSLLTYSWMNKLIKKGSEKPLEFDDIYPLPSFYRSENIHRIVSKAWADELISAEKNHREPYLGRAYFFAFYEAIIKSFLTMCPYVVGSILQPLFVSHFIEYVTLKHTEFLGISNGYGLVFLLFGISVISITSFNFSFFHTSRLGIFSRSSTMILVYSKALRLSSASRGKHTTGEIINLMSVDAERIWQGCQFSHWLWVGPTLVIVSTILIILRIGVATVAMIGATLIINYLQGYNSKYVGNVRRKLVKLTDERVKVMNEVLQGIRIIKFYGWEKPIQERIDKLRAIEVKSLSLYEYGRALNTIFTFVGPTIVTFVLFITFTALGGQLTVSKVYTTYALLNLLRLPFQLTPQALTAFLEAKVSLDRLTKFLILEEIDDIPLLTYDNNSHGNNNTTNTCSISDDSKETKLMEPLVSIKNADFYWESRTEIASNPSITPCLKNISLDIYPGEFIAVVGTVGSGKTSLLSAILGEMIRIRGSQTTCKPIAYVGQEHWIQNLKLIDNILLNDRYDDEGYINSVDASQLSKDLLTLPNSDYTSIGERGINLSGGQKARVNIARSLYKTLSNTKLYLFDDALAAVDVHVGKALFQEAINGILKPYARVIVLSSNYHLLPKFDKIIVILDGEIKMIGSYSDVIQTYPSYSPVQSTRNISIHMNSGTMNNNRNYELNNTIDHISSVHDITTHEYGDDHGKKSIEIASNHNDHSNNCLSSHTSPVLTPSESFGDHIDSYDRSAVATTATAIIATEKNVSRPGLYKKTSVYRSYQTEIESKRQVSGGGVLMSEEDRERGAVRISTYLNYFAATSNGSFGIAFFGFIIIVFALAQAGTTISAIWLGIWAASVEPNNQNIQHYSHTAKFYAIWYIVIVWLSVILGTYRGYEFITLCLRASGNLHQRILSAILNASIPNYFDITPVGRILNRFSRDLDAVDSLLPDYFFQNVQNIFMVLFIIIVCAISTAYFILLLIPIAIFFYYFQSYFRKSSREIKRLEGISRSPIYSHFGETLNGLSTIRAYNQQDIFTNKFNRLCDAQNRNYFSFWMASRWLAFRLDITGVFVILAVTILAVGLSNDGNSINPNYLGLALTYSLQLTGLLQWTVRVTIETENNMTSVERLFTFSSIESEAKYEGSSSGSNKLLPKPIASLFSKLDSESNKSNKSKKSTNNSNNGNNIWPSEGQITISNLQLRYRPDLDLVLRGVNLTIPGGSKWGVVGRTAAGKSSLMLALFRIVEPEEGSHIYIDGEDILTMDLHKLRSGLTIIPQDPVMFSGTLRSNLDPFNSHSDEEIWKALEYSHLKEDVVNKFPLLLNHIVSERGENISVGQKQLICIARALLRKPKILVLDEATASVDSVTDSKIQDSVRKYFKSCTVLTIAHRLETIADYDTIVVMDHGKVAEHDSPIKLLEQEDGMFKKLIDELGSERRENFIQLAQSRLQTNTNLAHTNM